MNKLVIIGNGFDLAHGLKTSYKDFLLWYLNKRCGQNQSYRENALLSFVDANPFDSEFGSLDDFSARLKYERIKVIYHFDFFKCLVEDFRKSNWVDIESKYYETLVDLYLSNKSVVIFSNADIKTKLLNLNTCIELLKCELEDYLSSKFVGDPIKNTEIEHAIEVDIFKDEKFKNSCSTFFLNFNYTNTINLYLNEYLKTGDKETIYIHGQLKEIKNPIIFGYGDESNKYFEKIEDLNNNEYTRHLKSFSYLATSNYKKLFDLLGRGDFEVYVLGHSLGLSDRLLFNHIFEHPHFKKVQLYYYEYKKDGVVVNDFFQKTQELSRHFKLDSKHAMRTKVVPFNESKPLTKFKPQN